MKLIKTENSNKILSVVSETKEISNCKEKGAKNSIEVECINGCLSIEQVDYTCNSSGEHKVVSMYLGSMQYISMIHTFISL